jgi:hypothetical protein
MLHDAAFVAGSHRAIRTLHCQEKGEITHILSFIALFVQVNLCRKKNTHG